MGGTFDVLHRGHRSLLQTAFEAGDEGVVIGVTTDAFANAARERSVTTYAARVAALEAFLRERGWWARAEVRPIDDAYGFALEAQFSAIAVTEETVGSATKINAKRREQGLPALAVHLAPYVLADDGRPIKATRVRRGEVDLEGHALRPLRVAVGSDNPVKVDAVKLAVERLFNRAEVRGFAVASGVPEQPWGEATWLGARARAAAALEAWPDADLGIGIEAGLVEGPLGTGPLDFQAAVVHDQAGRETVGHGPGFVHPPGVAEALRAGASVGAVLGDLSGIAEIGRKGGAIGYLSGERFTRTELTVPAVIMALLPRVRPHLYGL